MFEYDLALQLGKTHAELRRDLGDYDELNHWQAFFRLKKAQEKR